MSGRKSSPVPPATLESDREAIKALRRLPEYAPIKPEHSVEALVALDEEASRAEEEYNALVQACNKARDRFVKSTWAIHERMYDVKANVVAQFGPDSHEMSLIGLKRKSEYKRPARPKQDA
jgi:hypothetical protein